MSNIIKMSFLFAFVFSSKVHAQTFEGYLCSDDCAGHRAGYEWAMENYVTDQSECDGYSESFIEGCLAYVDNPYRDDTSLDDDGNIIEE
jgi:hypothetical protein